VCTGSRKQKKGGEGEALEIAWIGIERDGTLKIDEAERCLKTGRVKLLALTCVSNVLGVVTPFKELTKLAHEYGALVLLDAAQLAAHHPIDVQDLDCDFLVFSGHKVYGPMGIGVLYGKEELLETMPPFLGGGGMIQEVHCTHFTPTHLPEKFEAGTPPVAEARGLHRALDWLSELGWENIQAHERELLAYAIKKLSELPFVEVLGPKDPQKITGCISFIVRINEQPLTSNLQRGAPLHPHDLTEYLGRKGVCLRAGHHCAMPLHQMLGVSATSRLSLAVYNTREELDRLSTVLAEAFHFFTHTPARQRERGIREKGEEIQ
jgi:cysteine desulfurase/selenocysteine lyase